MITIDQALERLKEAGITDSIQMVRRWLRDGVLSGERSAYRKEGWRINSDDLERFISARMSPDCIRAEVEFLRAENAALKAQIAAANLHAHDIAIRHESPSPASQKDVEELWGIGVASMEHKAAPKAQDAAYAALIRNLFPNNSPTLCIEQKAQYVCPFTGKKFGSIKALVLAAAPHLIKGAEADLELQTTMMHVRERQEAGRYLDQI